MKLITKNFKKILKKIKLGMQASKIEATQYIHFRGDYIYSYCDRYSMAMKLEGANVQIQDVCINGSDFIKAIEKIKTKEITINITETKLIVIAGKLKIEFPTINDEYFIELIDGTINSHENKPGIIKNESDDEIFQEFVKGLLSCANCVAKDMKHTTLCCIYVDVDFMLANNNTSVIEFPLSTDLNMDEPFLIDGDATKLLKTLNDKHITALSIQSDWIHFFFDENNLSYENVDGIFSVRRVKGEYLNCDAILDRFNESEFYKFPTEAKNVLEIIKKISDKSAVLKVTESTLSISSTTTDKNNLINEVFEIKYDEKPFEVIIDISILTELLNDSAMFAFDRHLCVQNEEYVYVTACKMIVEE
jgi:hypothetical protein